MSYTSKKKTCVTNQDICTQLYSYIMVMVLLGCVRPNTNASNLVYSTHCFVSATVYDSKVALSHLINIVNRQHFGGHDTFPVYSYN